MRITEITERRRPLLRRLRSLLLRLRAFLTRLDQSQSIIVYRQGEEPPSEEGVSPSRRS